MVKQLLEKGYEVRGTVRSTKNHEKVAHLEKLSDALPGKLTLHEADLLHPGSFDGIVEGADFVFHMASPFQMGVEDPQRDLVRRSSCLLSTQANMGVPCFTRVH